MNKEGYKFDGEEVVHVAADAPMDYRPAGIGVIVGRRTIDTEIQSQGAGCPSGSILFQGEFGDNGAIIEMPEEFIRAGR